MKHLRLYIFFLLFTFPFLVNGQTNVTDSLQKVVAQGKQDAEEIRALTALADELSRKDMQKALGYQRQSIQLAKALNRPVLLSGGYHQMISLQSTTGNPDSAKYYLNLLKQLATDTNSDSIMANYHGVAGLTLKRLGDFKGAIQHLLKAEQMTAGFNNKVNYAGLCINIGNTYNGLGEYKKSLDYQLKALRLFEEEGHKRGQSFCYSNIGSVFLILRQYLTAKSYFEKSLKIKKELNDKRGISSSLGGMANVYNGLRDPDKAISYALEALVILKELKLVTEEAGQCMDIGKFYSNKGDVNRAVEYFNRCKELSIQNRDSSMAKTADAEIAFMQTDAIRQQQAEQKLYTSLQNSLEKGDKKNELTSYQYLAEYYAAQKQFDKALEYNKKFHKGNEAVQNTDVQLQIKKLESQYNIEKKEREIALLKKDQQLQQLNIQKQKTFQYGAVVVLALLVLIGFLIVNRYRVVQRSKRFIEIEGVRNTIARDLHDDMGSVLSSIHINSKMALENAEGSRQVDDYLRKIRENSGYMLESMSDIVWAINPANDTLEKVILRMKEFAADILEPKDIGYDFEVENDLSDIQLDPKQRKDFYLIFKEAINNAAKYSRCKNITVKLSKNGNNIMLQVTDDGTGFNSRTIKPGNGLANMMHRAKQMNGEIKINSAINEGTTITLNTISPA